jgi:hypothetical protein
MAHAQRFHFFGDSLINYKAGFIKEIIEEGIYSYINTVADNGTDYKLASIIKVDTAGKTIWSTTAASYIPAGIDPEKVVFSQMIAGRNDDLYLLMNMGRIGKIRASNGSFDWLHSMDSIFNIDGKLVDYNEQSILFANTSSPLYNLLRLNKYNKAKGLAEGYVDLPVPWQEGVFNICVASNGNIFIANKDSCYKFSSFDNPTLEWRVRRYGSIDNISLEGNNLLIFGNKQEGYRNGMIACIDITNGALRWFQRNGGYFDVAHSDHKIKNGNLYTSWRHIYYGGSDDEKFFVNKINISTGIKAWEVNHDVQLPTGIVTRSEEQAAMSLVVDDNETIFLAGYGYQEIASSTSLSFMKLKGATGAVLKRSFIPGSANTFLYSIVGSLKLVNGNLYTTGVMNNHASGARLDTTNLVPGKINLYRSPIQYGSSVVGLKNVSKNKKVMVKKEGKWLRVEMTDAYFNRVWQKTIGDTVLQYEGCERYEALGVNDSTSAVTVAGIRYQFDFRNYYFYPYVPPNLFFLQQFDSTGIKTDSLLYDTRGYPLQPYQFFVDSLQRPWVRYGTIGGYGVIIFPTKDYVGSAASGYLGIRPYQLIKPTTHFAYAKDTLLHFGEAPLPGYLPYVRKTWGEQNFNNLRSWFFTYPKIKWFNSVERETKDLYYVAARDSSDNDLVFKYSVSDSSILWSNTEPSAYVTIKGYELNGSFYALRTKDNAYLLQKYDGANGNTIWSKPIPVPAGHILKPADFALNKQRHNITIAGAVEDTLVKTMSKVFVMMYDTAGNVLHSLVKDGYRTWQNRAISITIGQDGQTLVSGQLSDSTHGFAGFIYEVDSTILTIDIAAPKISNVAPSVCSSNNILTGKLLNPVAAPYEISIVMDNAISIPFNRTDSTFSYPVNNSGTHIIRVSYSYRNSISSTDSSFIIKVSPPAGGAPIQSGNVLSTAITGESYQWYNHGLPISGATDKNYSMTQNGVYSYTYTVDGCVSPMSASLNAVLTSIVDPTNNNAIISIYPNPTPGNLTIQNLSSNYEYLVQIIDQRGRIVYGPLRLSRNTNYTLYLEKLLPGNYILQLWNLSKKVQIATQPIFLIK